MRKIQTQNGNPMATINNRNQSCDRIQLSHWLFEQMSILKLTSLWARLLSDCRRQRVVNLLFSTGILCRPSETSRVDATVLQYLYTILFTD